MGDAAGLEDDSDQPGGDSGTSNDGLDSGGSNGVHELDTITVTASREEELGEGLSGAVAAPVAAPFSWQAIKQSAIRNYTVGFTAHYQSLKALLGLLALHNAMQEEQEKKQDALEVDEEESPTTLEDMKNNPPTHPDYKAPKKSDGKKVKNPNGPGSGWLDRKGDVWCPTDHKGTHAPHYDVQHKNGTHTTVYP
jgi:hypothetical protein